MVGFWINFCPHISIAPNKKVDLIIWVKTQGRRQLLKGLEHRMEQVNKEWWLQLPLFFYNYRPAILKCVDTASKDAYVTQ